MSLSNEICIICRRNNSLTLYYNKLIRSLDTKKIKAKILYCNSCKIFFLGKNYRQDSKLYKNGKYRKVLNKKKDQSVLNTREFHSLPSKFKSIKNKNICDIGCGEGYLLNRFKKKNNVLGIDIDKEVVKKMKQNNIIAHNSIDDLTNKKKYKNYFDIIYCLKVIEHTDNPSKLIKDSLKLLRKNGTLIISTPNSNNILFNYIGSGYKSFFFRQHHNWYFNEESLKKLFEKLKISKYKFHYIQNYSISNFLKWMKFKNVNYNDINLPKKNLNDLDKVWKSYLIKNKLTEDILVELIK